MLREVDFTQMKRTTERGHGVTVAALNNKHNKHKRESVATVTDGKQESGLQH
jgi:hypothetical protein